jgi:hypothetical protein
MRIFTQKKDNSQDDNCLQKILLNQIRSGPLLITINYFYFIKRKKSQLKKISSSTQQKLITITNKCWNTVKLAIMYRLFDV